MATYSLDDISSMSDDELAHLDVDSVIAEGEDEQEAQGESPDADTAESETEAEEEFEEDFDIEGEDDDESDPNDEDFEEEEEDYTDEEEDGAESEDDEDDESGEDDSDEVSDEAKDFYEKVVNTAFKAAGQEMKVQNADEAIRLMQMGAGYHQKMEKMKPAMRYIKTLENAKLLDENKINQAIDLLQGKPDAVAKLLSEHNIDPLDLDPDKEYTPNKHTVSEQEVTFDEVVSEIQEESGAEDTFSYIRGLDAESRGTIAQHPQLMRDIHLAVNSEGTVHKDILNEVNRARILGDNQINGKSDLEAYLIVGRRLEAQQKGNQSGNSVDAANLGLRSKSKSNETKPNKARKKAANTARSNGKPRKRTLPTEDQVKNMSDEEFEKFFEKFSAS